MVATLPSEHMKDTLVAQGFSFGGTLDWTVYIGKQPPSPDRCIVLYDSAGLAPSPRWLLDYPSVQVRVRGGQNDYQAAGRKVVELRDRLVGKESYNAPNSSGDRIVQILGVGNFSFLGRDDAQRPEFVLNLSLIIEPSPATTPTNRDPL